MNAKNTTIRAICMLLAMTATAAYATNKPPPPPKQDPQSTSAAQAGAAAEAAAKAAAESQSAAIAAQRQQQQAVAAAQGGRGGAGGGGGNGYGGASEATGGTGYGGASLAEGGYATGGTANGHVNVGGDTSDYDSKALALSIPGLVAAPAVAGECRVHTRGWGGFSMGATGSTQLEKECMARVHCLQLADRYAAWGLVATPAHQLETCGGVKVEIPPPPPPVAQAPAPDLSGYVTREELVEHERRIIQKTASK